MFRILLAPTNLGLKPTGVERLGDALLEHGLAPALGAHVVGRVEPRDAWRPERDPATGLLNAQAIAWHVRELAEAVEHHARHGVPVVLGGDDTVLVGALLGMRRLGRFGLLFLDAHVDFLPPDLGSTGEASDSDLALVTGHGPAPLADIDGLGPLVRPADVLAVGRRDHENAPDEESQAWAASGICGFDLQQLRRHGVERTLAEGARRWAATDGVWIHLDCDAFDDALVPAVDWRVPGGLSPDEIAALIGGVAREGRLAGMSVSIYNPALDPDGRAAQVIVETLAHGLRAHLPHDAYHA